MPSDSAAEIETSLRAVGTPGRATGQKAYLKSDLEFVGATVPETRAVVKAHYKARTEWEHDDLVGLVVALWDRPVFELRLAAVELLTMGGTLLVADDLVLVERLIRESKTWALVNPLAATIAGSMVERDEALNASLDRWAVDDDFWVRRSALLALLGPLRRGHGDFERFSRYADAMLEEKEFFVRKAIGWVLRETAKKRPDLVAAWLETRTQRASGVTMREAVRPLSDADSDRLMAAYRRKVPAAG